MLLNILKIAAIVISAFSYKVNYIKVKTVSAVISSLLTILPSTSFAFDLENGATIFSGNCAACHAGGNNLIQNEKTLRKEALDLYLTGGLKIESIIYQVTNGKNSMPAFNDRLDENEIIDVANYVYNQATEEKWDSN
jgi:cytochrome c6